VIFIAKEKLVLAVLRNTNVEMPFVDFSMDAAWFFLLHHYEVVVDHHFFFCVVYCF
jgi:uncharacterized protein YggT (Ycf19 family)